MQLTLFRNVQRALTTDEIDDNFQLAVSGAGVKLVDLAQDPATGIVTMTYSDGTTASFTPPGARLVPRGTWKTNEIYSPGDVVEHDGDGYVVGVAHLSASFATDLAAGRLGLLVRGGGTAASIGFPASDGKLYGAKDGAWAEIPAAGGGAGTPGKDGKDGKSAFELATAAGFQGSQAAWLASLHGVDGNNGKDGKDGTNALPFPASDGKLYGVRDGAYAEIDVAAGANGVDGKSAYELAVDAGFVGSQTAWLASLKGAKGADGQAGVNGKDGKDGAGAKFPSPDGVYYAVRNGAYAPAPVQALAPGEDDVTYGLRNGTWVPVDGGDGTGGGSGGSTVYRVVEFFAFGSIPSGTVYAAQRVDPADPTAAVMLKGHGGNQIFATLLHAPAAETEWRIVGIAQDGSTQDLALVRWTAANGLTTQWLIYEYGASGSALVTATVSSPGGGNVDVGAVQVAIRFERL